MKLEFIGSIVVFLIAAFISLVLSFNYLVTASIIFLIWALSVNPYLVPFIAGIFLSAIVAKYKTKISLRFALSLLIVGVYLLSYLIPEKDFSWVTLIQYPSLIADNIRIIINTIASVLIIFSIMANDLIFNKINGRFFSFLGKLSFPLYLVHTLVICSISSFSYITMHHYGYKDELIFIITFLITLSSSIMVSLPLIYMDSFWLKKINKIASMHFNKTNPLIK
jgi:peptidoglycan/LPS O-acetylase OafA/YrhL